MKEFTHRIATYEDIPTIKVLMELSINRLLGPLLSAEQLEASFDSMGLDDQLIKDGTYFMIFYDEVFVGCGGWACDWETGTYSTIINWYTEGKRRME